MKPFQDHFSSRASAYAEFRPDYPDDLFAFLASNAPARRVAWDCATGNGQAAAKLARRFERVIATDASAAQIENAQAHERVDYRVARAEDSGLPGASIDLVTVAQAAHWFDLERFHREVARVCVPGGLVALWCYDLFELEPRIDAIVRHYYGSIVGRFWPSERKLVEDGYRTIAFPYDEIATPAFAIERPMTLDGFAGYVRTWSATRRFHEARGVDPVEPLAAEIASLWGEVGAVRLARWPIHLRAGFAR